MSAFSNFNELPEPIKGREKFPTGTNCVSSLVCRVQQLRFFPQSGFQAGEGYRKGQVQTDPSCGQAFSTFDRSPGGKLTSTGTDTARALAPGPNRRATLQTRRRPSRPTPTPRSMPTISRARRCARHSRGPPAHARAPRRLTKKKPARARTSSGRPRYLSASHIRLRATIRAKRARCAAKPSPDQPAA